MFYGWKMDVSEQFSRGWQKIGVRSMMAKKSSVSVISTRLRFDKPCHFHKVPIRQFSTFVLSRGNSRRVTVQTGNAML
jgi:hypothetical protein